MVGKVYFNGQEDLFKSKGKKVGHSQWKKVDQNKINAFALATGDNQWIHINQKRAIQESPFKKTIAHGYYTLSLIPNFVDEIWECKKISLILNYGTEKVRFISPVVCDDSIRAIISFSDIYNYKNGVFLKSKIDIEIKNKDKLAMSANTLSLLYFN